jgi:Family of unknown function (DUF6178)
MSTPQPLLVRLLNTPNLPAIVPQLQPEVLHRVIRTCGLEDCAELVALATPAQLGRVLDADVWRVRAAGADESFDADRFGLWIEVLMQAGTAVAAEKLVGLDLELAVEGFARHLAVYDQAAIAGFVTLDGEHVPGRSPTRERNAEIGGYGIEARRTSAWDALVDLLGFLAAEQPVYFHRLMRGCVRLSNGAREEDGFHHLLDDTAQHAFDLAADRDARRERQGYLTPAQAHAFLRSAREVQLDATVPPANPIARAYFREISVPDAGGDKPVADATEETAEALAFVEVLRDAGVIGSQPRALLGAGEGSQTSLPWLEAYLDSSLTGAEELGYLANAIAAGCLIQGRPFTIREAADGAAAIGNLGFENWPPHWVHRDLIAAFQVGWTVLHRDVCLSAARSLIGVLATISGSDRETYLRLEGLRRALVLHLDAGEPWRAGEALEALILLDAPSWAALRALIDECPVTHDALRAMHRRERAVNPMGFEFIFANSQIAVVRQFLASLPSRLAG